jgi:hypothetical protein
VDRRRVEGKSDSLTCCSFLLSETGMGVSVDDGRLRTTVTKPTDSCSWRHPLLQTCGGAPIHFSALA